MTGEQWTSIESRSVLPAVDQAAVDHLGQMARAAHSLHVVVPAVLATIRDQAAGHPSSRAADADSGLRWPWCFVHDQTVDRCTAAGAACEGDHRTLATPSDPTGSAAMGHDVSRRHHHELVRYIEAAHRSLVRACALAAAYPVASMVAEDPPEDPGTDLCRSCWKVRKYAKLVDRRSSGEPYYAGLCRWCGDLRAEIGGNRLGKGDPAGDPPSWAVEMHLAGRRVAPHLVAKARAEVDAKVEARCTAVKPGKKTKGKRR